MKRRLVRLTLASFLDLVVLLLAMASLAFSQRDRHFQGKPERWWIEKLNTNDDQHERWAEFGPEGVDLLTRSYTGANRSVDQSYRKLYRVALRRLPNPIRDVLPRPKLDASRKDRARIIGMLSKLGKKAIDAAPTVAHALHDEDSGVRMSAIGFFTDSEDEDALVNQLDSNLRQRIMSDFVRLLATDNGSGVRNNAALALGYFPEYREQVSPSLIQALSDPSPRVRLVAAQSLHRVDPTAIVPYKAVPMVLRAARADPDHPASKRVLDSTIQHLEAELNGSRNPGIE